ncbi:MAG: hypothetical protein LBN34_02745 [Clostridiales Family XIII bacterium]|jgi:hypothetical protein|nr:hypothetical protein [Clostridiales Family XIII bacterium]
MNNDIEADGMVLRQVAVVLKSEVNAVWVCRDILAIGQPYYTLLLVTDRDVSKKLVAVFADSDKPAGKQPYLKTFLWGETLCYLFPYHKPRQITEFAQGQIETPQISEEICINLLLTSIESPMPWPLLYLQFEQGMVNVEKDNSVYLMPVLNLEPLDENITESSCVTACARIMLDILSLANKTKLKSRKLLSSKVARGAYEQFPEVYHDFKLTVLQKKRKFSLRSFFGFFKEHRDVIFRVLLVLSSICFVVALVMLISYLIFGDFALFKLFGHSLKTIGTEKLNVR